MYYNIRVKKYNPRSIRKRTGHVYITFCLKGEIALKKIPINWIYRVAAALLVLVLMTSHLSSRMMARYKVSSSGGDGARVARFDVERAGNLFLNGIDVDLDPSSDAKLCADITVANHSEATIRCVPTVDTTGNLPVIYYWSTDSTGADASKVVTQVELAPNDSATVQLYLFVEWSDEAGASSHTYRREIDSVKVTLTCEQVD